MGWRKNCRKTVASIWLAGAPALAQSGQDPFAPAPQPTAKAAGDTATPVRSIAEEPRFHIRGAGWFSHLDGNLSVGNQIPGTTSDIDLTDTLNFDPDKFVAMGSVTFDLGKEQRWHLSLGYSGRFDYSGISDPLNISFNNLHYTGLVSSKARFDIAEVGVNFDIARPGPVTISIGTGSRLFFFDGSVTGTATDPRTGITAARSTGEKAVAPIPGLGLGLRWDITDQLYIRGTGEGIYLGNYGDYFDAAAEIGFDFTPNIGVFGGYRWMHAQADVSDVNFDVTIQGPYAGVEVRF